MNIALIGAGNIGAIAARNFLAAGHSVALSNSRGPDTLQALIEEVGFAPLDLGPLRDSHRMEPGQPIYNETLTCPEAQSLLKKTTA